ncbi:hypothetical protein TRVA0_101S00100 [Trichomonascus vanleenenianus]|uniref:uncharacterized protein n=1 Tax=Trichomonascus vanleenenianus TaxID=2268995 RepID=UPI003EC994B1
MTAQKSLRVGAVGAGRMGRVHIENIIGARNVELVAVCTVVEAEKEWICGYAPGVRVYRDYDEFVSQTDIDAIWISSPTPLHEEHLSKALANGKHVCCEKPLSADKTIAWKMYELSKKYPHLKVGCAFPRRFSKVYKEARKVIASGSIGDVIAVRASTADLYNPDPEFSKFLRTSGGIFIDISVHDIDIALYLAGKDRIPGTAFAVGTCEVFPQFAEWNDVDNAHGIVTMEDDLVFNIYASRDNRHGHHTYTEVIGTKGRIMINGEPRLLNLDISTENGTTMVPAAQHWDVFGDGFVGELEAFRDWVLFDNEDHGFNLKDAAKAVSIANGLNDSFLKKCSIPVKLKD